MRGVLRKGVSFVLYHVLPVLGAGPARGEMHTGGSRTHSHICLVPEVVSDMSFKLIWSGQVGADRTPQLGRCVHFPWPLYQDPADLMA